MPCVLRQARDDLMTGRGKPLAPRIPKPIESRVVAHVRGEPDMVPMLGETLLNAYRENA